MTNETLASKGLSKGSCWLTMAFDLQPCLIGCRDLGVDRTLTESQESLRRFLRSRQQSGNWGSGGRKTPGMPTGENPGIDRLD